MFSIVIFHNVLTLQRLKVIIRLRGPWWSNTLWWPRMRMGRVYIQSTVPRYDWRYKVLIDSTTNKPLCVSPKVELNFFSTKIQTCKFFCSGCWCSDDLPRVPLKSSLAASHERVAGEVGDATEVATVTCHQDVTLVAPPLTPAVRGGRQRSDGERNMRGGWASPGVKQHFNLSADVTSTLHDQTCFSPAYVPPDATTDGWSVLPVLYDPVLLPLRGHSVAHCQHGVIDVLFVTVGVVIDTWTHDGEEALAGSTTTWNILVMLLSGEKLHWPRW